MAVDKRKPGETPSGTTNVVFALDLLVMVWPLVRALLLSPRFLALFLWLFSDKLTIAFRSGYVAMAGIALLPYTTLAWAMSYAPISGVRGMGWVVVGLAFLVDIVLWLASGRRWTGASRR